MYQNTYFPSDAGEIFGSLIQPMDKRSIMFVDATERQ